MSTVYCHSTFILNVLKGIALTGYWVLMTITEALGTESHIIPEVNRESKNPLQALISTATSINKGIKTGRKLFFSKLGGEINTHASSPCIHKPPSAFSAHNCQLKSVKASGVRI